MDVAETAWKLEGKLSVRHVCTAVRLLVGSGYEQARTQPFTVRFCELSIAGVWGVQNRLCAQALAGGSPGTLAGVVFSR